jgi:hypothetical protein
VKKIAKASLLSIFLLFPTLSVAQTTLEEVAKNPVNSTVPYRIVKLDDPELKKIWIGEDGRDTWWHSSDDKKYAQIADFKNDLGQDVSISLWTDNVACAPMECPVRIIVAGEKVFDDLACRFDDEHTLSGSRNSVFLCDVVVPLRVAEEKKY